MHDDVASPCVKLCVLDEARGFCLGCGRTLDEIGRWARMSLEERRQTNRCARNRLDATATLPAQSPKT